MKKQSLLIIAIMIIPLSCNVGGIKNRDDYYFESAKVTEVWIWDRIEFRTDRGTEAYTTEEDFRDNFFYFSGGSHHFVVPYTFVFYDNGYYDACDKPYIWNLYLKDFADGEGPSNKAQFWKIEDSYFYTTHTSWKAKRDAYFGKAYKVITNNANTIVLQPIDDAFGYGGYAPGNWDGCTVTLKKRKFSDFHYDESVWW